MSIGGLLLRLRFSAKPFRSGVLDSLAERMGVLPHMSADPGDRWFTGKNLMAFSNLNRVVIGAPLMSRLTEAQMSAVAAHELVHVREGDSRYTQRRIDIPSAVLGVAFFLAMSFTIASGSILLILVAWLCGFFVWIVARVLLSDRYRAWRRATELRCDKVAASFVNPEDLIAALVIEEAMIPPNIRRSRAYGRAATLYPTLAERIEAIRAA